MQIMQYLLGVVFFCGVFLLGKWMADRGRQRDRESLPSPAPTGGMGKFVHYSGRICQAVAVVWGFLDAVSVMVLTAGWLTDLLLNLRATE